MKCKNKINHTCADHTYSTCTIFEGKPNTQSELIGESCLDQEIVDQDQYNQLEEIWSEIDLSSLGQRCLEYVETQEGKIIVKNVLLKLEEEICSLKEEVEALQNLNVCNLDISQCGLNFGTLTDECGEQPSTLTQVLQILLNQHNT